jgi:hypothetical protein
MTDPLRDLRDAVDVPPIDPARERALLEAFDAWTARAPRRLRWPWLAAAAAVSIGTAALTWIAANASPEVPRVARPVLVRPPDAPPVADLTGFVAWPGAHTLPPFESGEVRRVDIPVSALPPVALPVSLPPSTVVKADVLIGRDGFARAVRVVQGQGAQQ